MELANRTCKAIKDEKALDREQATDLLAQLAQPWQLDKDYLSISHDFQFRNFHQTMAFVNAVAWIAHQQDHHPDLEIGYKHCLVRYSTHSVGGLSEKDFICAARIEALSC